MAGREIELAIQATAGRLDSTLARELPEFSRSALQHLIREGQVLVNGVVIRKPGLQVSRGDRVRVSPGPAAETAPEPEPIALQVIYEDPELLVIDKPAGMVVHPAPGHRRGTLVNALLAYLPALQVGERGRPGIVHRLDKQTSGVMAVAKTAGALEHLQRQFKRRRVRKRYLGLVDGAPPTPEGEVRAAIGRDPRHRQRYTVLEGDSARPAVTRYWTREASRRHTLLELEPITGRTHQIRIHLQALGCPVVGDRVYGRRRPSLPVERQMLHAWRLEFELPGSGATRQFEAPIPDDLAAAVEAARAA